MNFKILYGIGALILLLGMLWMFLPHAFHNAITHEDETSHYIHLFQGAIAVIIGLIIMIISSRKIKKK